MYSVSHQDRDLVPSTVVEIIMILAIASAAIGVIKREMIGPGQLRMYTDQDRDLLPERVANDQPSVGTCPLIPLAALLQLQCLHDPWSHLSLNDRAIATTMVNSLPFTGRAKKASDLKLLPKTFQLIKMFVRRKFERNFRIYASMDFIFLPI